MKHHYAFFSILLLAFFVLSSCTAPYYITNDFDKKTESHKTVAVLPIKMIYTGKIPESLTEEDMKQIEEAESRAFQIAYYNMILRSTKSGKKPIRVDIQHFDRTNSLLAKNDIGIEQAWKMDPKELANIVGADAVITGSIEKHRLMSDLASFGIEIGIQILNVLSDFAVWPWLPSGISNSKEVNSSFSLIGAEKGYTLWSISYEVEADYSQKSEDIIDNIIRKSTKNFPYRVERK